MLSHDLGCVGLIVCTRLVCDMQFSIHFSTDAWFGKHKSITQRAMTCTIAHMLSLGMWTWYPSALDQLCGGDCSASCGSSCECCPPSPKHQRMYHQCLLPAAATVGDLPKWFSGATKERVKLSDDTPTWFKTDTVLSGAAEVFRH